MPRGVLLLGYPNCNQSITGTLGLSARYGSLKSATNSLSNILGERAVREIPQNEDLALKSHKADESVFRRFSNNAA